MPSPLIKSVVIRTYWYQASKRQDTVKMNANLFVMVQQVFEDDIHTTLYRLWILTIFLSLWESSSVETRFLDIVCSYFLQLFAVQRSSIGDLRDLWPFQPMIRVMRNIQRNGCSNLSHFNLVKDAFILKMRFPSWSNLMFVCGSKEPQLLMQTKWVKVVLKSLRLCHTL